MFFIPSSLQWPMKWFFQASIFLKERNSHWAHLNFDTGVLSSSVPAFTASTAALSASAATVPSAESAPTSFGPSSVPAVYIPRIWMGYKLQYPYGSITFGYLHFESVPLPPPYLSRIKINKIIHFFPLKARKLERSLIIWKLKRSSFKN